MAFLLITLLIALGINILLFVPAFYLKTDKLTDFAYSLSFVVVAAIGFVASQKTIMHSLAFVLVLTWATRLGSFLVIRIRAQGHDRRFDEMRNNFRSFLTFWLSQGLSAWVILLPALLLWQQNIPSISVYTYIGLFLVTIGIVIEAAADTQKFDFIQRAKSKSWIDTGVWRVSRHPNYLGEITVWVGMYLFTVSSLSTLQALIGLISPLFIASLLLFVSGIPILEKNADKRWGKDKAYQQYKKEVPVLVPTPRSIARLFS